MYTETRLFQIFSEYLNENGCPDKPGFMLKKNHTQRVMKLSRMISEALGCSKEDVDLAVLIALLHDIGRFDELRILQMFDSSRFNHAMYGAAMLFDQGLIRRFQEDDRYDGLIRKAIENHSRLAVEEGLDERTLFHCRVIRDADKLDNFHVKLTEKVGDTFAGTGISRETVEDSRISPAVLQAIRERRCVKLADRHEPLDYYVCIMAFAFDLYFPCSYAYVIEKDYIRRMYEQFSYHDPRTAEQMQEIFEIISAYVKAKAEGSGYDQTDMSENHLQ